MSEQKLRDALRELPRVSARDGFTQDVLARLDDIDSGKKGVGELGASGNHAGAASTPAQAPTRSTRPWLGLAAAAAIVFVTTFAFVHFERHRDAAMNGPASADAQTLNELRAEHEQLRSELAQLMQLRPSSSPVVYLGGTDDLDIVFDLERASSSGLPGTMPASYTSDPDARSIY